MDELSDTALVKLFQRGDIAAFTVFAERHRDRLYRQACIWVGEVEMAQDAVQETFLRSYQGLGRFRFRAEPATWLARVCRNVCYEMVRKRGSVRASLPEEPSKSAELDGASLRHHVEGNSSSSLSGFVDDASGLPPYLTQILGGLPVRQREVVVLRLLEEYSVRETAKILRCREGTVKAHLSKAMANLRKNMDGQLSDFLDAGSVQ